VTGEAAHDPHDGPIDRVSLDESLGILLLVVLRSLTPEERVAFVLHDVFGVPYGGIADVVGRSPEMARELARSARSQIQQSKEARAALDDHRRVVLHLRIALEARDEPAVRACLHADVTVHLDTGGRVAAAHTPTHGIDAAATLLMPLLQDVPAATVSEQSVNGRAGLAFRLGDRVTGVLSAEIRGKVINEIWIVQNPEKLAHWQR